MARINYPNSHLLAIFKAIEREDVDSMAKVITAITHTSVQTLNEVFHRRDNFYSDPHYENKCCLEIFFATLNRSKYYSRSVDRLLEIFKILVHRGMEWEKRVPIIAKNPHFVKICFIDALCSTGNIEFFIRILPWSKDMMTNWRLSRISDKRPMYVDGVVNTAITNFMDENDTERVRDYISILNPEIKASLISSYIYGKRLLDFLNNGSFDLSKLVTILKCGEINWKDNQLIKSKMDDISNSIKYIGSRSDEMLTVLCLLVSAGYKVWSVWHNTFNVQLVYRILGDFLLEESSRWLLTREILPIVSLPIPLESRINLWAGGVSVLFDRRKISLFLKK